MASETMFVAACDIFIIFMAAPVNGVIFGGINENGNVLMAAMAE